VWLTGIEAAGKTTIGGLVADKLRAMGAEVEVLDGDEIRRALSPRLGYTEEDRDEHTRRVAWVAALLARHGVFAVVGAVSPRRAHRGRARALAPAFAEVWVKATVETAAKRDPKGLYAKAARGEVKDLASLHTGYEEPEAPDVVCDTDVEDAEACAARVVDHVVGRGWVKVAVP